MKFLTIGILSALSIFCYSSTTTIPLIPHHVQRQRRVEGEGLLLNPESNFRRRDKALEVGALYHGYGTHYIDLWVGTPPQRQTVIVDTGSGVTSFPCSGCKDCGAPDFHIDKLFVEGESSTFSKVPCGQCQKGTCSLGTECRISMSYQEGSSWSAYEAIDRCYVGGPHKQPLVSDKGKDDIDPEHASAFAFPLDFGCQTKITGLFKTQMADGIMGMEDTGTAFWYQMFEAGKMGKERKFSLCFSRPLETSKDGSEAGAMTLGGSDERLHDSQMVYSERTKRNGFYNVILQNVYLRDATAGESAMSSDPSARVTRLNVGAVKLNAGGAIVDSGTTDTYFSNYINSEFLAAYKGLTGKDFNHDKQNLSVAQVKELPTILIQLKGNLDRNKKLGDANRVVGLAGTLDPDNPYDIILAIPPSHYMEPDAEGMYTSRFYTSERSGTVLGANSMMGHDIMFDVDNSVIGWAESTCDYEKLLIDNGYTDVLDDFADEGEAVSLPSPSEQTGKNSNNVDDIKADIKQEFDKLSNACDSWYCKGGLIVTLLLFLFCGCCIARCCCQRRKRNLPSKYARAEVEMNSSFNVIDQIYKDKPGEEESYCGPLDEDPNGDEYGEFEFRGNGVAS
jgi:hypothetical protein